MLSPIFILGLKMTPIIAYAVIPTLLILIGGFGMYHERTKHKPDPCGEWLAKVYAVGTGHSKRLVFQQRYSSLHKAETAAKAKADKLYVKLCKMPDGGATEFDYLMYDTGIVSRSSRYEVRPVNQYGI
jgi:hypothetical protein